MQFESLEWRIALSAAGGARPSGEGPITLPGPSRVLAPVSVIKKPTPAAQSGAGPQPLLSAGTNPLALAAQPIAGGIRIVWQPLGLLPEGQIVVFRKSLDEPDWVAPAVGEPTFNATFFDDLTAEPGVAYEYKVVVYNELGAAPSEKYILAGNAAAAVHSRGTALLVVDQTQLDTTRDSAGTTLLPSLRRYQADLILEGYRVLTITAPRVDLPRSIPADHSPASLAAYFGTWSSAVMSLKAQIRAIYEQTPDLSSILLLGHVAVPYSGMENPDGTGHALSHGAWPADVFYGTLTAPDSVWTDVLDSEIGEEVNRNLPGDGKFDQDLLMQLGDDTEWEAAAFTDVPVGRVDFATLYDFAGIESVAEPVAGIAETKLLSRYLEKDHEWRTGQWVVDHKALFDEAYPFAEYYDTNRLTPNIGFGNIVPGFSGPTDDGLHPQQYDLTEKSWLWLYVGAPGYPSRDVLKISFLRSHHTDHYINGIYAREGTIAQAIDEGSHKAVFNFMYGSYVGDWDHPNSILRAAIAEPDGFGLASAWGARPNWNQHRMGLGEPIGDSLLKSLNSFGVREAYMYDPNESNIRLSLLGDPTLRQENVIPPTNVESGAGSNGVGTRLTWTASADTSVTGYYIYRSSSPSGPFTQLNSSMTAGTTYTDAATPSTTRAYYLVRAAKLQSSPSGTYWNLSLGATVEPRVMSARFISSGRPQAIEVTFNQDVGTSLSAEDLIITGQVRNFATGVNAPIALTAGANFHMTSYSASTRTARFEFGVIGSSPPGEIPSGRYTLRFKTGALTGPLDEPIDLSYTLDFAFLVGDADGDLKVDFNDLVIVAQHYGAAVTGSAFGDLNGDGRVDFDDLVALAQHYGASV